MRGLHPCEAAMGAVRKLFRDHRRLAALLVALALCIKTLVPAGFMIGSASHVLTVQICADTQGTQLTRQIVIPQKGGGHEGRAAADQPCAFGALAMASLAGTDIVLLAPALAFILALGFAPLPQRRTLRRLHIRPPLRGPPASA